MSTGLAFFGAAKARAPRVKKPLSVRMQAVQAKLAQRKSIRCSKIQQRIQNASQKAMARIQKGHWKKKDVLLARIQTRLQNTMNKWSKRCGQPTALSAILDPNDDSQDANIVDASDYAGAMSDWQDCMKDEATCATDDCGFQKDCDDPDNWDDDKAGCLKDWKDCMSGDKTCATDWCGTKPVIGVSGLGVFSDSVVGDAVAGAAGGSILGPIGAIAGAAGGILSSILGGNASKDAAKAQAKALAAQKKLEQVQVAAQQQAEVFTAQQDALSSQREQKTILIGIAGVVAIVVVGGLVYKIVKK